MVYTADEVQEMLHIGRNSIYDYLGEVYREQYPFRVIKIGKQYRIPKASFYKWIQSDIWTKVKKLKGLNIKFKPFEFLSEGNSYTKTIYLDQNLGAMHCISE